MRRLGRLSKLLVVLTALSLPLGSFAPALAAEGDAVADRSLEGKILTDDGQAIEGAKVKLRNLDTGEEFTSAPTGGNGSYKLDNLPPGRYEISVQTERGVYLGNRTVDLINQKSQTYSFSLKNVPPEQALEEARRAREEEEGV
ncbi:MAG: carboxypeptidase-like regulatory domain-containing protein, partial [Acidobacteria bacterium]|nr:carboxypeptidase-like regulatory domain-containing protein [Acidobacteriota bacterium]